MGDGQGGAKPAGSGAKPKNTAWDRAVKDLPTRPAENEQARTPTVVVRADRALRLGREIRKLERQMGQVHLYEPDRTEPPSQPELDALPALAPSPLPPPSVDEDRGHGRGLLLIGLSGLVVALGILVAATLRRGQGEIAIEPMPQAPPAVAAGPLPPGESPAPRPAPGPEPTTEVDELPAGETPVPAGAERPDPSEPPPEGELPAHAAAEPAPDRGPEAGSASALVGAAAAGPTDAAAPSPSADVAAPIVSAPPAAPAASASPAARPSRLPAASERPPAAAAAPQVRITIQTRPANATVLVDGMPVDGRLDLPRGPERHVLVVQAPGHRSVTRAFDARRPTTLRVTLPRLPPEKPAPAAAASDKPPLGEAPLVADRPEAPSPPATEPAPPESAADAGVAARPDLGVPSEAFIEIVGAVDGARIQVDTRPVGVTPLPRIAVRPGRHTIWAEADGHEIYMRAVEVKPGATLQLKVSLQKIETIEDL